MVEIVNSHRLCDTDTYKQWRTQKLVKTRAEAIINSNNSI
jgi:hypothetical protein